MNKVLIIAFLAICLAAIYAAQQDQASSEENKALQPNGNGRYHGGHHRRRSTNVNPFSRAKRDIDQGGDGVTLEPGVSRRHHGHGHGHGKNRNRTGGQGQWRHNKTGGHGVGRRWRTTALPL